MNNDNSPYPGPGPEYTSIAQLGTEHAPQIPGFISQGEQQLVRAKQSILSPLYRVLDWKPWELLVRLAMIALVIFVLLQLYQDKNARSVTNYLLLLIAVSIMVQIQQNVNVQQLLF